MSVLPTTLIRWTYPLNTCGLGLCSFIGLVCELLPRRKFEGSPKAHHGIAKEYLSYNLDEQCLEDTRMIWCTEPASERNKERTVVKWLMRLSLVLVNLGPIIITCRICQWKKERKNRCKVLREEKRCAPSACHGPVMKLDTSIGPPKKKGSGCVRVTVWMLDIIYDSAGFRVSGSTRKDPRCLAVCTRAGINSYANGGLLHCIWTGYD